MAKKKISAKKKTCAKKVCKKKVCKKNCGLKKNDQKKCGETLPEIEFKSSDTFWSRVKRFLGWIK